MPKTLKLKKKRVKKRNGTKNNLFLKKRYKSQKKKNTKKTGGSYNNLDMRKAFEIPKIRPCEVKCIMEDMLSDYLLEGEEPEDVTYDVLMTIIKHLLNEANKTEKLRFCDMYYEKYRNDDGIIIPDWVGPLNYARKRAYLAKHKENEYQKLDPTTAPSP